MTKVRELHVRTGWHDETLSPAPHRVQACIKVSRQPSWTVENLHNRHLKAACRACVQSYHAEEIQSLVGILCWTQGTGV